MFHKRLLNEFKDLKVSVIAMVMTQVLSLLANIVLMVTVAKFIEQLVTSQITKNSFIVISMVLLAVILMKAFLSTIQMKQSYHASTIVKVRLRDLIFEKLMKMGGGYRNAISTSEVVQISTEGVEQLEIYFGKYIPQFFYSMLAPIILFFVVGSMDIKVASILLICVPLIPLSIIAVQKFAKKMLNKYWGTYTQLGDTFLESLHALTTLKIYQADKRYARKMDEESEKFRNITMRVLIMQLNSISVMDLIAFGGAALGIVSCIFSFQQSKISFYQCFFIIMISAEFFLPLRLLGSFFHIAMNGNAAANKIFALLDHKISPSGTVTMVEKNDISFQNVSFSYEDRKPVLKNLSFTIQENKVTAIVGTSGCGKSTITSLIMREQQAYEGDITLGGVNSKQIEETYLYQKITRISHNSHLFKGTLRENLLMGKNDATDLEMIDVLIKVDLYDTVLEKGGLDMAIEEQASNLSGGQKQRVALARAILHNSDIYIFDEATSNVDVESENKIIDVIYELASKKTMILISHRLANIVKADHIVMLEAGSIIEEGTHSDLIRNNGAYCNLYNTQKELEEFAKDALEREAL